LPIERFPVDVKSRLLQPVISNDRNGLILDKNIKTAESYFSILEDLFLAYRVPVFRKRVRRTLSAHPKFFFFDTGVFRSSLPWEGTAEDKRRLMRSVCCVCEAFDTRAADSILS
jgi:predicted AAA+ superfamily ATPase